MNHPHRRRKAASAAASPPQWVTNSPEAAAKLKAADAAYDKRIAATQGMRLVDKIQAIATARAIRDAAYRVAARLDIEADYERDPANHPQNQR